MVLVTLFPVRLWCEVVPHDSCRSVMWAHDWCCVILWMVQKPSCRPPHSVLVVCTWYLIVFIHFLKVNNKTRKMHTGEKSPTAAGPGFSLFIVVHRKALESTLQLTVMNFVPFSFSQIARAFCLCRHICKMRLNEVWRECSGPVWIIHQCLLCEQQCCSGHVRDDVTNQLLWQTVKQEWNFLIPNTTRFECDMK